jgi:hypothetical protein
MTAYQLTNNTNIIQRTSDSAFIPNDPRNRDYQAYLAWVAEGNTPDPYVVPIQQQTVAVDAFCSARLASGYADTVSGKTFACDDSSLIKWNAIASAAIYATMTSTPTTFELVATDGTTVTLSAADTLTLLHTSMMAWIQATLLYANTMKNNIVAGNSPTDITVGWP